MIDYTFIRDSVCRIGKILETDLTDQQHYDIELICQDIAKNERAIVENECYKED